MLQTNNLHLPSQRQCRRPSFCQPIVRIRTCFLALHSYEKSESQEENAEHYYKGICGVSPAVQRKPHLS